MSVRVLVIGDPHVKVSNVTETEILVADIVRCIELHDPHFVVVLGDTLHRHNIVEVYAEVQAIKMMREIAMRKPLVLIIGNHDLPSPNSYLCDTHPFNALKMWNNVLVVDKQCQPFDVEGYTFAALPYVPPGMFMQALNTNEGWRKARAIFAHQEFSGCRMDRVYSKNGDQWDPSLPLVISGHIHQYQRLGNNIIYVGTPRQSSFGDTEDKTLSLFTFTADTFEEVRIRTSIPKMIEYHTRASDIDGVSLPHQGTIKLVIHGTKSANASLKNHPSIQNWKRMGVKIVFKEEDTAHTILHTTQELDVQVTHSTFMEILLRRLGDDEIKLGMLASLTN